MSDREKVLLEMLDNVSASLETVVTHQGPDMTLSDLKQRSRLVSEARALVEQMRNEEDTPGEIRLENHGPYPEDHGVADQFSVFFGRPGFVNVLVAKDGVCVAHVYDGLDGSEDHEPIGAYDNTLPDEDLTDWEA